MNITPIAFNNFNTENKPQRNYLNNSSAVIQPNSYYLGKNSVYFGIGKKKLDEDKPWELNIDLVRKVHNEAERPAKDLMWTLKKYLRPLVATAANPNNPICAGTGLKCRIKNKISIGEKATVRDIDNKLGIMEIGDVIGCRIILRDSSRNNVDKVLKQLTLAVKNGDLNVIEIENYRPTPKDSYASKKALDALEKACNPNVIKRRETSIPSGYTAIHLGVLTKTGHVAEIQIMGRDVEELKELEDFSYKIRCGKHLECKYKEIEDEMLPAIKGLNDSNMQMYMQYIRDSYAYVRQIAPKTVYSRKRNEFLPIPYFLPKVLDFNYIADKKARCDHKDKQIKAQHNKKISEHTKNL